MAYLTIFIPIIAGIIKLLFEKKPAKSEMTQDEKQGTQEEEEITQHEKQIYITQRFAYAFKNLSSTFLEQESMIHLLTIVQKINQRIRMSSRVDMG